MTAKRPSTLLLSGAIAGFMVSTALAQASNYTSIEVPAGKAVQLTYHASRTRIAPRPRRRPFASRSPRRAVP